MRHYSLGLFPLSLALLSGALLPLSLSPFDWWPIAILSTACLYFLCQKKSGMPLFFLCTCFGIGLYGSGVSWVYVSIHDYGNASALLATLLTSLFVIALAVIFALPLMLLGLFRDAPPASMLFAFPAAWVIGEWTRTWFLTGFPWLNTGYALTDTWLAGWAPLLGVLSLSGLIAFCGAFINLLAKYTQHSSLLQKAGILLGITCAMGFASQTTNWTLPAGKPLHVALIQPVLPVLEKWQGDQLETTLANFQKINNTLRYQDLIVWPEAAIPTFRKNIPNFFDTTNAQLSKHQTGVITGIPTLISSKDRYQYQNSVIGLGAASGTYSKRRLVPFGEYVPLEHWLRGTIDFFNLPMSAFSPGLAQQNLLQLGSLKIATAICYEIAYPDLIAGDAGDAQLLLTVSNDTWFGRSLGPHQHQQIARMRAIENAKPLLRATNDGFTAVINPDGSIAEQLPRFVPGILKAEVTPYKGATPFNRWGSVPIISLSFATIIILLIIRRLR